MARRARPGADPIDGVLRALLRAVPLTVLAGIIFSVITISLWGWKEYFRMMLQGLLGLTLAAAIFWSVIKRWERKLQK